MKTLYAVNASGRRVARLVLAEGADHLDAELFVLRGNVPGAIEVNSESAVPSLQESARRIDEAIADLHARPAPAVDETPPARPGSLEESERRIAAAINGMDGNTPAPLPASRLLVVTVPKQEPSYGTIGNSDQFNREISEVKRDLSEAKAMVDRLQGKQKSAPAPRNEPGKPVEIREVPIVKTPTLEESEKRIAEAIAAF